MFLDTVGVQLSARRIQHGYVLTKTIQLAHLPLISTSSWQLILNLKDKMIEENMRRQEDLKDVLIRFDKITLLR